LQLKLLVAELGKVTKLRLKCDAQAAIDGSQKLSGSRLRHLEIAQSYSRSLLRGKHAEIDKVSGKKNVSDCLTKHLNAQHIGNHILRFPVDIGVDQGHVIIAGNDVAKGR